MHNMAFSVLCAVLHIHTGSPHGAPQSPKTNMVQLASSMHAVSCSPLMTNLDLRFCFLCTPLKIHVGSPQEVKGENGPRSNVCHVDKMHAYIVCLSLA